MELEKVFGTNMRYYRKRNGWSQEKLAEEIDVSTRTVQNLESGRLLPSLRLLIKIGEAYGVELDDLLGIKRPSTIDLREMISEMTPEERKDASRISIEISKMFCK